MNLPGASTPLDRVVYLSHRIAPCCTCRGGSMFAAVSRRVKSYRRLQPQRDTQVYAVVWLYLQVAALMALPAAISCRMRRDLC